MKRDRDDMEIDTMAMANCLMLLSANPKKVIQGRVFSCKTCNREFHSFQALGGHRATHKKPKMLDLFVSPPKPKTHECSICGLEFPIGQALGGHMRRHRGVTAMREASSVLKKSNFNNRVLSLDLNLSPIENDLMLQLGNVKSDDDVGPGPVNSRDMDYFIVSL